MDGKNIVVVGAGVAGLTSALLLSENHNYQVTVAAKHMPGDYDIEYASPWAGASYMPVSVKGSPAAQWDKNTWGPLEELARNHPEAGIHFQNAKIYNRKKDSGTATATWFADLLSLNPWWANLLPDYRLLSGTELPAGTDGGKSFTSVCINTSIYLPYLVSECLKAGVVLKRAIFKHIADAALPGVHHSGRAADLVVNCTGLSASKIGGVEDKSVVPARGQTVLVRNHADNMYSISGTDDASDEVCYIMTRAAGGGTILGGCYQKGNWESQPDPSLATRIMKRCVDICPQLTGGQGIEKLDIVRHNVGLRPTREGGARVEREQIDGLVVVHNYGHGGAGYQSSYGCSEEVVRLVKEAFSTRAKL